MTGMGRFIGRRLLLVLVTLWVVTLVVFSLSRAWGDPREMYWNKGTTKEQWDAWGREWGLDKPLPVQYLVWLGNALRGNLGLSMVARRPVTEYMFAALPATMLLSLASVGFTLLGIPIGVLSAVKRGTIWDLAGRFFAVVNQAVPPFWLGLMLILIFSVQLGWLPAAKMQDGWKSFVLPTITLGGFGSAGLLRLVRSSMLNVLDEEYIKLARSKGVARRAVIWRHAFKNAMIAPLNYVGFMLGGLATGAVVVETVFGWPGMGRLALTSAVKNDFPTVAGLVLFFTVLYVGANFLVDVAQAWIDPRIRYT